MEIKKIFQSIKQLFTKKEPLSSGLYAYQTPPEAAEQYRLHLRIENDGSGILIVNAATVLHLNQTAVEFAYHLIKENEMDQVVNTIASRYKIDKDQIRLDYGRFLNKIQTIIQTPDLDPVTYLDIERQEPYSGDITAPYRLDCALTYQVRKDSHQQHAPIDRVDRELSTQEWVTILHKAYQAGIPQIIFTGGEPTLREDLPQLVLTAEELGMVTGLLSDGAKLGDEKYLDTLLASGLDHLMMVLNPENNDNWRILEQIVAQDLFTAVHLTLRQGEDLKPAIQRLAQMGANALSLSAADKSLTEKLQNLRDYAAVQQLELVWDVPVPYSSNNPVSLELENAATQEVPDGAGKAWLYVEPDGDVLPTQGMYDHILGNILTDPWEEIWDKRLK